MKFLELELLAFGGFTGKRLDLASAGASMHVIYGPNEAGKSTALRAVLGLLYGIDERTSDAYLHERSSLRIAARLRGADGSELAICRRKGKKDTLLGPDDRPIDEALLARMLGNMPEPLFRTMFGLDHERLRSGGEQLRSGRGDLGESLFQAGAGAADIHRVLSRLDAAADELFRPRAKKSLNEAIRGYEQAKRQVREHAMRAGGFREQEHALEQAKAKSAALHQRRRELLAEQSLLERAARILPALGKRNELLRKRSELGDVVKLPHDASEQRRRAQAALTAAEGQARQLRQRITELENRRAALAVPGSLASLRRERVVGVRNRLGNHLKARDDLPKRKGELAALVREAENGLRALGQPVELSAIESLRIDVATETRIGKLSSEHSGLCERLAAAERDLEAASAALAQARGELELLEAAPESRVSAELPALPKQASVVAFRQRFEALAQRGAHLEQANAELLVREQRSALELDTIAREGAPPHERDLERARSERDAGYRELRAAFADNAELVPARAAAYEALVQRADELSDRLRREATRVSRNAQLLAERDAIAREQSRLAREGQAIASDAATLESAWRELFAPLGVVPSSPAEMQALLGKIAGLCQASERGRASAERRREDARRALDDWRNAWAALMQRLKLAPDASVEEALAVLAQLRRLFDTVGKIEQLEARIEGINRDAEAYERDLDALLAAHLPEASHLPLEQAAELLLARHEQASADLERQTHIDVDLASATRELETLEAKASLGRHELDALARAARVSDLETLAEVEHKSALALELEQRIAETEDELLLQGEGASVAVLIEETRELASGSVRARLFELKEELDAQNDEHAAAVHESGRVEAGLQRFKTEDQAAEAAAEAEQYLSRVRGEARQYLVKKLAAEILRHEIARYRERNQAPIVSHASELFARLTLGRYPELRVDYDEHDELILKCGNAEGAAIAIEHLSDGARDQLYLALRLSSLRLFSARSEPMPLLLDDVLIHFDDERARAALEVLGEFSELTQVLFFTHHARIVELARRAIGGGRLAEHRLDFEPRVVAQASLRFS